ncbi:MAG TPA: guanine deaminase [Nodosilinea sp.]|nr:guanine deaminase [Nodosilinea sp.]
MEKPGQAAIAGRVAIRGALVDCVGDPFYEPVAEAVRYLPDGLLVVRDGLIEALGPYADLAPGLGDVPIIDHRGQLITPGFIDTHIHYPQTGMMAAYGEQLLEWLNRYTFPTEGKFADADYARSVAELFLDQLLSNGTTTALVFAAVFPASVEAFFEAAEARHLRMISGKVMMDRNAPDYLSDTAQSSYDDSRALIEKWHGRGRLLYAVTPRFAGTSTEAQLRLAARLLDEFPDVYLHTHLSENVSEVAWIKGLFPQYQGYLDVYDQTGLVRERSLFAHGVQLTDAEFQRLSEAKAAISFCPTSNLFLGSGLFRIEQAKNSEHPVKVGLGTDVGAGTSFSMLQTTNEAYKVAQLRGQKLSAFKALFLATLGGARALGLEDKIGSFAPGNEADFVVLDPQATPLLALRNGAGIPESLDGLEDLLFALVILGCDRAIAATYIMGEQAYSSESPCTP